MSSWDDLANWVTGALAAGTAPTPWALAYGLGGASLAYGTAELIRRLGATEKKRRLFVVVVPDEDRAAAMADDLSFFLAAGKPPAGSPIRKVLHLPVVETSPYAEFSPERRVSMKRLGGLFRLAQGFVEQAVVISGRSLGRRVIPRAGLEALSDLVVAGQTLDREALLGHLTASGYLRASLVEDPGSFAVRGGVIDVWSPLGGHPVRIELVGDDVETLRAFEPSSQRTLFAVEALYLPPARETVLTPGGNPRERVLAAGDVLAHPSAKTRSVLEHMEAGRDFFGAEALVPAYHADMASVAEYLPEDAVVIVEDAHAVLDEVARDVATAAAGYRSLEAQQRLGSPPESFVASVGEVRAWMLAGADKAARQPKIFSQSLAWVTAAEVSPSPSDEEPGEREMTSERGRAHDSSALEEVIAAAAERSFTFAPGTHADLSLELKRLRSEQAEHLLEPLAAAVRADHAAGKKSLFVAPTRAHAERLEGLLAGYGIHPEILPEGEPPLPPLAPGAGRASAAVLIALGHLSRGFRAGELAYYTEEELFGPRAKRRSASSKRQGISLGEFRELVVGDLVVHTLHGVGRYKGLVKLAPRNVPMDFVHIEYEDGVLYLPVYRLSQLERYVGGGAASGDGSVANLDKLGGKTFEARRAKVRTEVRKLAEDLLQLYAQRQALPGHAFGQDSEMFHEFEATFPFEETPDQERAISEVLTDMEAPRPMDRLVCGDVGYGKTEIALRAAFKAVLGGKQVAVLAPTTILVEQHYATFRSRMADYPVRIGVLSRFRPPAEQKQTLAKLANKSLDIVIGTHRLLSRDVRFGDIGLLVIDEEQRFGVAHKERLRALRTQVDTITLTATPIPRTLHLAFAGLREMSILATPPADRLAIRTSVGRWDGALVAAALKKEIARGGQAFVISARVEGIESLAQEVRELVPEANVVVAHGQMPERVLERAMIDFVGGRFNVLVATTIVENGVDIPRANTMIVRDAHRFGLAQLYQLRGRIGRSKERAHCYLLVPAVEGLTGDARARLEVLQRFSELGAGFQIAQHDLEIRGAGELLGDRQSGQIAAVGFETYTHLLEEAVAELRGEPLRPEADPDVTSDLPAYIPDDYCPDVGQRLDCYKRFASATAEEDVEAVLGEVIDRYGPAPEEVELLANLMKLKVLARQMDAAALDLAPERFVLRLGESRKLDPDKVLKVVARYGKRMRLTPGMEIVYVLSDEERKDRMTSYRRVLRELLGCVT